MITPRGFALAGLAGLLSLALGCSVAVDKSKDGEDKNVKIETPLGGIHVSSDGTNAADVGLPVYPGAHLSDNKSNDKSADVRLGFGDWQFRLKVVKYRSPEPSDKILAFYKKALGRYGDVIQCNGDSPAGTPKVTHEGLTCDESQNHPQVNSDSQQSLKAGSKRHQHVVGIESSDGPGTVFSLIEINLPASTDGDKNETN